MKKIIKLFLLFFLTVLLVSCEIIENEKVDKEPPIVDVNPGEDLPEEQNPNEELPEETSEIDEFGIYNTKDEVALYLVTYYKLPSNYLTKEEAKPHISSHWTYENKLSVGGDRFYNREGLLPNEDGRLYYELDINYNGGNRNSLRIVYSNDGLIFYTDDHYESFVEYDKETRTWK